MTYNIFNNGGKGLKNLSDAKIKDFKIKMKVAKVMRWYKAEAEILQAGFDAIEEKYTLENEFDSKGVWLGKENDKKAFTVEIKEKLKEKIALFAEEVESVNELTFTEDEISAIDELTGNDIADLMSLGLLTE
jgi:hypothetical protein